MPTPSPASSRAASALDQSVLLSSVFRVRQAPLVGRLRVGDVAALDRRPDLRRAVVFVEAALGDALHPLRRLDACLLHRGAHAVDAQRVPHLERAHLPAKAPADRAVDVGRRVGDLGHAARRVAQQVERRAAEKVACAAVVFPQRHEARIQRALELLGVDVGVRLGRVLHRLGVDRQDRLALLLEEARLGLLAHVAGLDELVQHVRDLKHLAALVIGHVLVQVRRDVPQRVQPHHIRRAERGALGVPDERARQRVHLLDREAARRELLERAHHPIDADPVADKVRRVLGDDDALAQVHARKRRDAPEHVRVGVGRRDDLEQLEVARRVEKVRAQKARLEVVAAAVHDVRDRQARRVGRDDGIGARSRLDPLHHRSA